MYELKSLESAIMGRNPLNQYSTNYEQIVGWTTREKWDPNRPGLDAWLMTSRSPGCELISVPVKVSGRRIAVIDDGTKTVEALVVGYYALFNDFILAVVKSGSNVVSWNLDSGQVSARQVVYGVRLEGKTVVGITRREMSLLHYLANNPQNL